jgi:hypothetical protein
MPNLVLRSTLYTSPDDRSPFTLVVRASDLARPIREAADTLERDAAAWGFVVNDIFEVGDGVYADAVRTTLTGSGRLDGERKTDERHMCISYFWNLDQLERVNPRGVLVNPGCAPLTVDQLQVVMRQLARHPHYKDQTLIFRARDNQVVTFREGRFTLQDPSR